MALTGTPRERGVYDDKKCFERYMTWGAAATHAKLRRWCISVGMVNPATGTVSQMGPFWAAWRYALNNIETPGVFEMYREWWFESDAEKKVPTFLHFIVNIQNHAWNNKSIASQEKYDNLIEKYNLPILPQKVKITFEQRLLFGSNGHIGKTEAHEEDRQNQEVSVEAGNAVG